MPTSDITYEGSFQLDHAAHPDIKADESYTIQRDVDGVTYEWRGIVPTIEDGVVTFVLPPVSVKP